MLNAFAILIFEPGAVECPYWTYCIEGSLRDDYVTGKIVIEYAGESGTPYYQWEKKQAPLEGEALKRQLKKWVREDKNVLQSLKMFEEFQKVFFGI